jgi:hypothetical protein
LAIGSLDDAHGSASRVLESSLEKKERLMRIFFGFGAEV